MRGAQRERPVHAWCYHDPILVVGTAAAGSTEAKAQCGIIIAVAEDWDLATLDVLGSVLNIACPGSLEISSFCPLQSAGVRWQQSAGVGSLHLFRWR